MINMSNNIVSWALTPIQPFSHLDNINKHNSRNKNSKYLFLFYFQTNKLISIRKEGKKTSRTSVTQAHFKPLIRYVLKQKPNQIKHHCECI